MEDKSTFQISPSTLFSKRYSQFENQMTHALLQFIDAAGYDFLLELTKEFSKPLPKTLLTIQEQIHKKKKKGESSISYNSVPDGQISTKSLRIIIESKIVPNHIKPDQLQGHHKMLNDAKEDYKYLLYITPDICEPEALNNYPDIEWLSWIDIIDCIKSYAKTRSKLEYLSNAIIELSDKIKYDHMVIPIEEKVLILAGRYAERKAVDEMIYHCQKDRKFADCKYVAFCSNNKITHIFEFEKSDSPYINDKGEEDDLYILKESHHKIITPIINDKKSKNSENGRIIAYTRGSPRYVTLGAILKASTTAELDRMTKDYINSSSIKKII